jgi:hypothetical protein
VDALYDGSLKDKHVYMKMLTDIAVIIASIIIWQSLPIVWSALFVMMPFAAYFYPILSNRGVTAFSVTPKRAMETLKEDIMLWFIRVFGRNAVEARPNSPLRFAWKAMKHWRQKEVRKDAPWVLLHGLVSFPMIFIFNIFVATPLSILLLKPSRYVWNKLQPVRDFLERIGDSLRRFRRDLWSGSNIPPTTPASDENDRDNLSSPAVAKAQSHDMTVVSKTQIDFVSSLARFNASETGLRCLAGIGNVNQTRAAPEQDIASLSSPASMKDVKEKLSAFAAFLLIDDILIKSGKYLQEKVKGFGAKNETASSWVYASTASISSAVGIGLSSAWSAIYLA